MINRIVTYHSANAEPSKAWMGFIENVQGRLGIYFTGATEDDVKGKVKEFWAAERAKHEAKAPKKRAEAEAA